MEMISGKFLTLELMEDVLKGKFGNYFELDLKDDDTEKFFKILGEQLQSLAEAYLDEKPWNLKSPIVEYGVFYSIHCKIPKTLMN